MAPVQPCHIPCLHLACTSPRARAGLAAAAAAVRRGIASGEGDASLPGMIFNLSKQVTYTPAAPPGAPREEPRVVHAGRMECTMQNLADSLTQTFPAPPALGDLADLGTFVVFNERRYVTSSAKRALKPGSTKVAQTPEGALPTLLPLLGYGTGTWKAAHLDHTPSLLSLMRGRCWTSSAAARMYQPASPTP